VTNRPCHPPRFNLSWQFPQALPDVAEILAPSVRWPGGERHAALTRPAPATAPYKIEPAPKASPGLGCGMIAHPRGACAGTWRGAGC
jgi:hypothetical protein